MKIFIYDTEIIKCIPLKDEKQASNLSYCKGWDDYVGMEISVIGTWRNYDLIRRGKKDQVIPLVVSHFLFCEWLSCKNTFFSFCSPTILWLTDH